MEYRLKKGGCTAAVETMGGELVSFQDAQGTEYIWGGDPASWPGRNPNLFPIVGALRGGEVLLRGKVYRMPRHGFARRSEFSVAERGEDYAVLELRENPATLEQYPYPFVLRVRHRLLDGGFETRFEVRNSGPEPMPFCIGAHTGFRCPLAEGEAFEDYRLVFDEAEDADTLLRTPDECLRRDKTEAVLRHGDTIPLDHKVFDRLDTLAFQGLRSRGVCLRHKDTGRGVRVEFGGFPMLAFWTMPGASAPYLCIEPWHGCAAYEDESGRFEDKAHCILLAPGGKWELGYTVRALGGP